MEPLGGIEPPTFALPRRRYTPKPQWQWRGHQWTRFNHCGFSSEEGHRCNRLKSMISLVGSPAEIA